MRNLVRMFAASALMMFALTFAPKPVQATCQFCWNEGECRVCVDDCSYKCIYTCPWGDGTC